MKYFMRAAYANWSIWVATIAVIIFVPLALIYQDTFFTPLFFLVLFVVAALVIYVIVKLTIIVVEAIKEDDR
jgi:hypothetical protein